MIEINVLALAAVLMWAWDPHLSSLVLGHNLFPHSYELAVLVLFAHCWPRNHPQLLGAAHSSLLCGPLGGPMDGRAWYAAVHGVAKSRTRLSDFPFTFHFHALEKEMATHSSVLPGESQGWGSLVGFRLWGRTESDTTEAT